MSRAGDLIQEKIYAVLLRHQQQPLDENTRKKFKDIVKRLEEGLLRAALSKEEYMNLETLESRLLQLIKRSHTIHRYSHMIRRNQHPRLVNSSSPVGTMIPTPEFAQMRMDEPTEDVMNLDINKESMDDNRGHSQD